MKKSVSLGILGLMILTACGNAKTIPDYPCPARPTLETVNLDVSDEVRAIVVENYIRLMDYAQKLEIRAGCK